MRPTLAVQPRLKALRRIEVIAREAANYEDFYRTIQHEEIRIDEELSSLNEATLSKPITTFAGEEHTIPRYIGNLIEQLSSTSILHLTEQRRPIGKDEAARLLNLKVKRGGTRALRTIQTTVTALLGVQIDAYSSDISRNYGDTPAELDVDDFLVQANGSGIREALRLILDVEFEQPSIILVEEPEVHLHPALETTMMQYLKNVSKKSQVFLTTHSTNFLDTAEMKNVYLVGKNGPETSVEPLDLETAETRLPVELGLRLSSLFMYDRLVQSE